jgi:hypothetical protein
VPLLDSLGEWLEEQSRKVLPKSPIGQAISYTRAQWEDLQTYTRDGELSIDNNVSERSLRAQAIGRKNYRFVGSDRGGQTGAVGAWCRVRPASVQLTEPGLATRKSM